MVIIALIIALSLLVQTTFFQNFLIRQATSRLSHDLKTTVRIKHVDFELFNSMLLEGTLVEDLKKDTLLYAGAVKVNITDWFFFKDKIELKYIGLQDAVIKLNRTDSVWNYQFLADYFTGPPSKKKDKNIDLNLKQIEIENLSLAQVDGWRGEDLVGYAGKLLLNAEELSLEKKSLRITSLDLDRPRFAVYEYDGARPPRPPDTASVQYANDPAHLRWNPDGWTLQAAEINISNGEFKSDDDNKQPVHSYFDGSHILFAGIDGRFSNCVLKADTLTAEVRLKTVERSGFRVDNLSATMKMHPEAMEFSHLDVKTPRSHLHDYFAMRYNSFDDMSHFISRVTMEGHFNNAEISSDDIAFFAPELRAWKKHFVAVGVVKGTVDKLNGRKITIQDGKDTYFKGSVTLNGLPDVDKTFLDIDAEDFRTNYTDAVSFVPQLKDVRGIRLDLLQRLRFKGNFTGFLNDFVTYGHIETALGSLTTDLNMKFPGNLPTKYSGTVQSPGFDIGDLIENRSLGKIVFEGKVNGSGLSASSVNAELDGNIRVLEFNDYAYNGISVKGKVSKKLFNGDLVINDENLQARMDGLIDFSKAIPEFNFDANITKADLRKVKLMKDDVQFDGKFRFNFKGKSIDDFLGTARVYDASLFKSGKRIAFDSLFVESKIQDSNKVITATSNEFEAVIAGEFSLKDLPASFQTFLNKYYPAYIAPSKAIPKNEIFSFVVTTRRVDDYIGLIDPNLSGFNFSTVTGRINTRENLLDVSAEVPQFNYKNVAFYDVRMRSGGSYDSLSADAEIGNVYINDSLNFPGTVIKLKSAKDLSDINIKTSANQTLNSANVNAQVQTLPKGVRIKFRESTFDVNGKTWNIEKDGELVLAEDQLSATGVKLYSGLQEIHVTSSPSALNKGINDLKLDLVKVNIGDFTPYLTRQPRIEGSLTGNISLTDPFGKLKVNVAAEADEFRLDNDSIGKVQVKGDYYKLFNEANFTAVSDNKDYHLDIKGIYQFGDSTHAENIDVFTNLHDTKIDALQTYLSDVFTDVGGLATGVVRVKGPSKKPQYLGSVHLMDATMRVKFTNVVYHIPDVNIEMKEDRIDFGTFTFRDKYDNPAQITHAVLYHENFQNFSFDFAMNSPKLLVLATNSSGGDPYYGTVIAKTNMTFKGPIDDMEMNVVAEPADSSTLIINTKSGKQSGQADFIVWKVYGREMQAPKTTGGSNLTINLDVTANNYANLYVILDEVTGDVIQATGSGNLKIMATTDGEFAITGKYNIDRGNYKFNFGSFLKKPFRLREDAENYIQWSGDPNNATIRIDAEYEAENVSFSDLGSDLSSYSLTQNGGTLTNYRGKVLVVASLSEQLLSPLIKFRIELPANSPLKNDFYANNILAQIEKNELELNKQVTFLVVLNSFGPLTTSTNQGNIANTAFQGIVVSTISGVLSNTLSREVSQKFQQLLKDRSIKVNFNAQFYNGTSLISGAGASTGAFNIDRTNLNLSIGKSLFDERLTFNFGSAVDIGFSSAQTNRVNSKTQTLPFLPDINAEWKITPDGKFALTFFYRDSYNFNSLEASSTAGLKQNRTGASISYRKEFEKLSELVGDNKKKKKKKK